MQTQPITTGCESVFFADQGSSIKEVPLLKKSQSGLQIKLMATRYTGCELFKPRPTREIISSFRRSSRCFRREPTHRGANVRARSLPVGCNSHPAQTGQIRRCPAIDLPS